METTLFKMTEFDNIFRCWLLVKRGKNTKNGIDLFERHLYENLIEIQQRLRSHQYNFGPYHSFVVREKGKQRDVVNTPLRDKIVHWLLYRHLSASWGKKFICDSFGNIEHRGTHKAVQRLAAFGRSAKNNYALKMDISKYFHSIPHATLKAFLRSIEKDTDITEIIGNLIDSYTTDTKFDRIFPVESPYHHTFFKGIPIGNLTSQVFANIYLNHFDHWMKESLKTKCYIRYVDDIVVLDASKHYLLELQNLMSAKLLELKLTVNPRKISIRKIASGIPWLGYIVWPNHISAGRHLRSRYHKCLHESSYKDNSQALISYEGAFAWTGATR